MARPSYHHGNLRRAVLDASLALIDEVGVAALSMREVARRAGVTHAAPYAHFADRGDILAAIATEGFELLEVEMRAAVAGAAADGETAQFEACGRGYFLFALGHRAHFRVMFRPELSNHREHPEVDAAAARTFNVLVECVLALQERGIVPVGDFRPFALTGWSVAHGLAALCVDGPLSRGVLGLGHDLIHLGTMVSSTMAGLLVRGAEKPRKRR